MTSNRSRFGKPMRFLLYGAATAAVGGVCALLLAVVLLSPSLPSIESLAEQPMKVPMRVYSTEGRLLAEFGEEKRILLKTDEIQPLMVKAILAAEDRDFYSHHGVDFTA
jgi:penicillin-binding protein 1A